MNPSISRLAGTLALALTLGISACATRTQTIVVIDGDATVRAEAATLDVSILGPTGESVRTLSLHPGVEVPAMPFTIALEPSQGDASRRFTVDVTARRADGSTMTRARTSSGYVSGRALELRVYLEMQCATVSCTGESTCRGGRCDALFVDPSTLPPYPSSTPDAATSSEAGPGDAGPQRDAGDAGSLDAARADGGPDAGASDAGGTDAGSLDAGSTDAGNRDAGSLDGGGRDAGTDAATVDGGRSDGGTPSTAGPLGFAGASGASVEVRAFGADESTVCFGGEADRAIQIGASPIPTGSSGMGTAWIACYDVTGAAPTLRFARAIESIGGMRVGGIALDDAGTVYALVYSDGRVARTFDGIASTSRAFALRFTASGTIDGVTALLSETLYVTAATVAGSTLYVTDMDTFGNSAAVSRIDLGSLVLQATDYLTTGWHYGLAFSTFGVVLGRDEAANGAVVHRVALDTIRPPTWSRRASAGSEARAATIDGAGEIFVAGAAHGDLSWAGDTHVTHGTDTFRDAVLTRMDGSGNVLALERIAVSTGEDFANVVMRDGTDVVVAGNSPALDAPPGLTSLPSDGGSIESWVIVTDASTCAPTRWERLAATDQVSIVSGGISGGWLYVAGMMRGTARAVSSPAFGASGATAAGVQDGFLVRMPIP